MEVPKDQHHIVMLPFMAQGHMIPFLALANQIHRRFGFKITIAATPLNLNYLKSTSQTQQQSQIHFFELPFNSSEHGLPPNTENTEALPLDQIVTLFESSTSLETHFRKLISHIAVEEGRPPICVISDVFMGWANEVAKSCGTVNVSFSTCGGYGSAAYVSMWQHLPHRFSEEFNLPGFPDSHKFHVSQIHQFLRAANGEDSWSRFFQPQIAHSLNSSGWLCNSVEEIEPFGLDVLRKYTKLPVWCVGPLLPQTMLSRKSSKIIGQHTGRKPGISPENCLKWLELNQENSVLYISFGSQNTISSSQMMALALGLEDSKKPFVWVIRPPVGFNLRGEFESKWLPEGFEERMEENKQGLVVHGWAPQLEILCHKSTGAFLSHCGWNSILESLSQGVPIIGWPLAGEQAYNSKMLMEEMGVCVELTRGLQSSISREEVKNVVDIVIGEGGKGEDMRKKAGEIGELMRGAMGEEGSSLKAMDDFVNTILRNRQEIA